MKLIILGSADEFDTVSFTQMNSYHWEAAIPYRPDSLWKLAFMPDKGFYCALKCFEKSPKAVYTDNDMPVYRDSCLEFFVAPVSSRSEYINIECNSLGYCLCEFGASKNDRRLVCGLCGQRPEVTPFSGQENGRDFWGVNIFLPLELISELYGIESDRLSISKIRANFYKCGDDTDTPHYIAFSPVSSLPPGFHNPGCFADFTI